jgi:hypothetical protein
MNALPVMESAWIQQEDKLRERFVHSMLLQN